MPLLRSRCAGGRLRWAGPPRCSASPELRERELAKLSDVAAAITDALRERGIANHAAVITAEVGMTVFRTSYARWVDVEGACDLGDMIRSSFDELRAVIDAAARPPASA